MSFLFLLLPFASSVDAVVAENVQQVQLQNKIKVRVIRFASETPGGTWIYLVDHPALGQVYREGPPLLTHGQFFMSY